MTCVCYHVTLSKFKHQIVKNTGGCYPLQFLLFITIVLFFQFYPFYHFEY